MTADTSKFITQSAVIFISLLILHLPARADNAPNIIVVVADDLGYGDIGPNGQTLISTPFIDKMAEQGVQLTNFYASAPNCTPSRAGLMTGRYAIRMGLAAKVLFVNDKHGLPAEELTIPEILKDAGYTTAMIGKWHLGHMPEYWPTLHGFDSFYGLPYSNNQTPLALYRNDQVVEEPVEQSTLTLRYIEEAVKFIEQQDNNPFFLYIAHTAPHVPLHVSGEFEGRSMAGLYGDVVEELDWSMGELFAALKKLNLDENTLVIFTSDNGPYPLGSPGDLRGGKGTAWDGGFKVPFIARWPGKIPAGKSSAGIAMNIDLLPTLATLSSAILTADHLLDGQNIWPLLQGENRSAHEKLYFFYDEKISAVRTQNFKMLLAAPYTGKRRWFPGYNLNYLFDMRVDPQEQYSMTEHYPEVWNEMQKYLATGQAEFSKYLKHE
jgi:arylsulfatase A